VVPRARAARGLVSRPALIAENIAQAGLGNRIRFTLSAQAIAEAEGRHFYYVWPTGPDFEPAFTDLWAYDQAELPARVVRSTLTEKDDLVALRKRDLWTVRSASELRGVSSARSWEDAFRALAPVAEVADRVGRFRAANLPGPYVGVQVRASERTHAKTLAASPVSWFIGRMREMLEVDPHTRFFLSCDSGTAQEAIRNEFPSAVALEEKGGYNTAEGVRASVVDLYLLAGSTHLLGPYWSSFVDLAWVLSGKAQPLETSRRLRPAVTPA
jgi:hypothetical protein